VEIICYEWVNFGGTVAQSKKRAFRGGSAIPGPEAEPQPMDEDLSVETLDLGRPRSFPLSNGNIDFHGFRYFSLFPLCASGGLFSAKGMSEPR
jgi:hypothetical protein